MMSEYSKSQPLQRQGVLLKNGRSYVLLTPEPGRGSFEFELEEAPALEPEGGQVACAP